MDHRHRRSRQRRGLLIVLSSPSGAGKSTISRMLLDADDDVTMSISATTRPKRPGEIDDVDYHFVDDAEFDRMIADSEFVEWAHVFGHRYGTPKAPVKDALREGRDILFDIDWQGARQLEPRFRRASGHASSCCRRRWPSSSSGCASAAPDLRRGDRRPDARARRTRSSHWAEYEYVLVNRRHGRLPGAGSLDRHRRALERVRQTGWSIRPRA